MRNESRGAAPTVRDAMRTEVVSATPETTVEELIELLREEEISGVPVVDRDGSVVGVVSETDVLRLALDATRPEGVGGTAVRDLMTPARYSVSPDAPLEEAARLMADVGINRALVFEEGRLAGIVTSTDVLRGLSRVDGDD